ncbi:hypothetical protein S40293_02501 [Stachybotrys chartarum IBT 40293]|nr:hypothetical protein S40293_02501 [Stachybotrys chartarum IBT 40293]
MSHAQGAVAATTATTASHPYTCNTCQVAYRNIDLQKGHMKSDWHRYNLKRRVASLPPISADTFTEKVLQARAASDAQAGKALFERSCASCSKTYYSENAYQNHLSSQKHRNNETAGGHPLEDETTSVISSTFSLGEPLAQSHTTLESNLKEHSSIPEDGTAPKNEPTDGALTRSTTESNTPSLETIVSVDAATPIPATDTESVWSVKTCIFCNYDSPSASLSAHHMERFHGMFIPEKPFLVDLDGLISHLQRRVRERHQCVYCSKFKSTAFAVQTHMRDKGHCKIPFSTEKEQLDIGDFYDFRGTYSDGGESDTDSSEDDHGGAKLAGRRSTRLVGVVGVERPDVNGDVEDGWETDSSASSLDSAELTAVPAEGHLHQFERLSKHPHHSRHDSRHRHQADGWHSHGHKHAHAVFYDDYELHLPSGRSVGHRSLNRYFRQNLNNYPTPEERAERNVLALTEAESEPQSSGHEIVDRKGRNQGLAKRNTAGMVGVSVETKQRVRKAEQRGRDLENSRSKRNDWSYGKKLNNQESYYYRYQKGG